MKICGVAVHALLLSCYMLNGFALIFFIVMRLCLLAPTEQAPAANFFFNQLKCNTLKFTFTDRFTKWAKLP